MWRICRCSSQLLKITTSWIPRNMLKNSRGRWTIFSEFSKKNPNMSSNPKLIVAIQIQRWITEYGLFPSLTHLFVHPLAPTKLEKPPIRFRCHKEHINARTTNFACGNSMQPSAMPASLAVLWLLKTTLEPHSKNAPKVYLFWKECWKAWEDRMRQVEGGGWMGRG